MHAAMNTITSKSACSDPTVFSAISSYTFFDLHSHLLLPASIFHPPPQVDLKCFIFWTYFFWVPFVWLQLPFTQPATNIATIVSICLSFAVFLVTVAVHIKQKFNLKKIKRKLGFNDRPAECPLSQVPAEEDDKEDILSPGSPQSIVYSSHREEHQFILDFPHSSRKDDEQRISSSPCSTAVEGTNTVWY